MSYLTEEEAITELCSVVGVDDVGGDIDFAIDNIFKVVHALQDVKNEEALYAIKLAENQKFDEMYPESLNGSPLSIVLAVGKRDRQKVYCVYRSSANLWMSGLQAHERLEDVADDIALNSHNKGVEGARVFLVAYGAIPKTQTTSAGSTEHPDSDLGSVKASRHHRAVPHQPCQILTGVQTVRAAPPPPTQRYSGLRKKVMSFIGRFGKDPTNLTREEFTDLGYFISVEHACQYRDSEKLICYDEDTHIWFAVAVPHEGNHGGIVFCRFQSETTYLCTVTMDQNDTTCHKHRGMVPEETRPTLPYSAIVRAHVTDACGGSLDENRLEQFVSDLTGQHGNVKIINRSIILTSNDAGKLSFYSLVSKIPLTSFCADNGCLNNTRFPTSASCANHEDNSKNFAVVIEDERHVRYFRVITTSILTDTGEPDMLLHSRTCKDIYVRHLKYRPAKLKIVRWKMCLSLPLAEDHLSAWLTCEILANLLTPESEKTRVVNGQMMLSRSPTILHDEMQRRGLYILKRTEDIPTSSSTIQFVFEKHYPEGSPHTYGVWTHDYGYYVGGTTHPISTISSWHSDHASSALYSYMKNRQAKPPEMISMSPSEEANLCVEANLILANSLIMSHKLSGIEKGHCLNRRILINRLTNVGDLNACLSYLAKTQLTIVVGDPCVGNQRKVEGFGSRSHPAEYTPPQSTDGVLCGFQNVQSRDYGLPFFPDDKRRVVVITNDFTDVGTIKLIDLAVENVSKVEIRLDRKTIFAEDTTGKLVRKIHGSELRVKEGRNIQVKFTRGREDRIFGVYHCISHVVPVQAKVPAVSDQPMVEPLPNRECGRNEEDVGIPSAKRHHTELDYIAGKTVYISQMYSTKERSDLQDFVALCGGVTVESIDTAPDILISESVSCPAVRKLQRGATLKTRFFCSDDVRLWVCNLCYAEETTDDD